MRLSEMPPSKRLKVYQAMGAAPSSRRGGCLLLLAVLLFGAALGALVTLGVLQ